MNGKSFVFLYYGKIFVFLCLFGCLFPINANAESAVLPVIKMNNGESINAEKLGYKDDVFLIGEKKISPDEISHIIFQKQQEGVDSHKLQTGNIGKEELLGRAKKMSDKYPDQTLLVLLDDGTEQLRTDGTQYSRARYAVKICNESQLSLATLKFGSLQGKTESKLIYARSISPDGKEVFLDLNNVTYTTPSRDRDFFGNNKEEYKIAQYVIPEVAVGSIIDYEYERISYSEEDPNQYYVKWWFSSDKPVYQSTFKVMVPQNKPYYFAEMNIENGKLKRREATENGYRAYYFEYGESAPIIAEEMGPETYEIAAYVEGSSFKDQTYLSDWLGSFFKERMTANEEIENTVNELLASSSSEDEKIAALYRFVQDNIRYVSIKTSLSSGLAGHKAAETFGNRYGDCIDKAILFATMLQCTGIEAYPVVIMTNGNPQPLYHKLGVLNGNHAINELHLKSGKIIYLDSTANCYRYPFFRSDDHGVIAWNPIKNTLRNTGFPDVKDESITSELDITLLKNGGANVKETLTTRGNPEITYRYFFQNAPKDFIHPQLESLANVSFESSHLVNYDFADPFDETADYKFQMNYKVDKLWNEIGNDLYLITIRQPFGFDFVASDIRNTEVRFDSVLEKTHKGKIVIPAEMEVVGLPDELIIESPYLHYKGSFRQDKNVVYYENVYSRNGTRVPVNDYSEFRNALIQINDYINKPVILQKRQ